MLTETSETSLVGLFPVGHVTLHVTGVLLVAVGAQTSIFLTLHVCAIGYKEVVVAASKPHTFRSCKPVMATSFMALDAVKRNLCRLTMLEDNIIGPEDLSIPPRWLLFRVPPLAALNDFAFGFELLLIVLLALKADTLQFNDLSRSNFMRNQGQNVDSILFLESQMGIIF